MSIRPGVRIGVDVGTVRIGVASCDRDGLLATPLETVPRDHDGDRDFARLVELVAEYGPIEVLVGLPLALSGTETASTRDARGFAETLARRIGVPVRYVDERLTSVSANAALRSAGRSSKKSRSVVDQVAAVILLQHALDAERSSGRPAGRPLAIPEESEQQ